MPSPKSGKSGTIVPPASPDTALNADDSVAGGLDDPAAAGTKTGQTTQLGSTKVDTYTPFKSDSKNKKATWIEILLVDEAGAPVAGEPYQIVLPDGQTAAEGTLDEKGFVRIDGIDPGTCQVSFPQLDMDAWKKA